MIAKKTVSVLLSLFLLIGIIPSAFMEQNEHVTLSILMYGIPQTSGIQSDDPVSKWVLEKTGITLDVMSTAGMNIDAELNAMIASNSLPDIIVAITPEQRQLLHDTDSIIPLDELVEKYAPEITDKAAGRMALSFSRRYFGRKDDKSLYFLNLRAGEDFMAGFPTVAPYIRWDVYDRIGKPAVRDMDALLDVLKQMQDAYPRTEDGKKVYAISGFLGDAAWNTFSLTAAEAFFGFRKLDMYGLVGANIRQPEIMFNAMENADSPTWQLIRYFNKAYRMGILDPETVTMKFDQWMEKVVAGQILYAPLGVNGLAIMNDSEKAFLPVRFDEFVNDSFTCSYTYSNGSAPYAITRSCKNPEKAMQLLNLAWSTEGAMTFVNGVEGDTWERIDGKPVLKSSYVEELDAGNRKAPMYSQFFGPFMDEETNEPINLVNGIDYFRMFRSTKTVDDYLKHYDIQVPIENFLPAKYHSWNEAFDRGVAPYTGDLKEIDNRVQEYVLTNIPRLVIADSEETFESMRTAFMEDVYALGAQQLIDFRAPLYTQLVTEVQAMIEEANK